MGRITSTCPRIEKRHSVAIELRMATAGPSGLEVLLPTVHGDVGIRSGRREGKLPPAAWRIASLLPPGCRVKPTIPVSGPYGLPHEPKEPKIAMVLLGAPPHLGGWRCGALGVRNGSQSAGVNNLDILSKSPSGVTLTPFSPGSLDRCD